MFTHFLFLITCLSEQHFCDLLVGRATTFEKFITANTTLSTAVHRLLCWLEGLLLYSTCSKWIWGLLAAFIEIY